MPLDQIVRELQAECDRSDMHIETVIEELQKERPIFHSEADFQHALAWEVHLHYPKAAVRLEVGKQGLTGKEHIDILIRNGDIVWGIELKYRTMELDIAVNSEKFSLCDQQSCDTARHDLINDIVRLERFVDAHPGAIGYVIFLTNDENYWKETKRLDTNDAMLRIHEGRMLGHVLRWSEKAAAGTIGKRERQLTLRGSYQIHWSDYAEIEGEGPRKFRYVLLPVTDRVNVNKAIIV